MYILSALLSHLAMVDWKKYIEFFVTMTVILAIVALPLKFICRYIHCYCYHRDDTEGKNLLSYLKYMLLPVNSQPVIYSWYGTQTS